MGNTKIIGFAGIECYDLMVYTAKTIDRLGCSCILIDNSDTLSLAYVYQGNLGAGDIASIGSVDIGRDIDLDDSEAKQYDYVLAYFGFSSDEFSFCDELYCITDFQRHNIERISEFEFGEVCRFLVVRNSPGGISIDFLIHSLSNMQISQEYVFEVDDSDTDIEMRMMMHHTVKQRFNHVSSNIRNFVIQVLNVDFQNKEISKAFKLAAKG